MAITLDQAIQAGLTHSQAVAASQDRINAAERSVLPAGQLPDPKLNLGLRSIPLEGPNQWRLQDDGMSMQTVGIVQQMPSKAKRHARVAVAEAGTAKAQAVLEQTALEVQQGAAEAWIRLYAANQRMSLLDELYHENRLLQAATQARLASGAGLAAESVIPERLKLVLDDQHDSLERDRQSALHNLVRWVGDAAHEPLTGDWPHWDVSFDQIHAALPSHPRLKVLAAERSVAEGQLALASANKTPDWSWGLDYQHRGNAYGDMISVSVSFDLPLLSSSRQDPLIESGSHAAEATSRDYQDARYALEASARVQLAELDRLERAINRLESGHIPLAEQRVRLAMADYRASKGMLRDVIAAREELVELRMRQIDLEEQKALAVTTLHLSYGETH
jgi:outer membrane protein TolC